MPATRRGRHGSWYLSLELPPALDGSRRRIRRGGFPRRPHAEMALARLRMPSPGGSPLTVGQWLEHWLVSRTAPRISTLRGYATHIRLYLAPCLGQILLADLTPAHVQAMFTAISRQHEAMGRPVTDLGSGTAFISWQLRQYDGHVVLCPPKTARSERVIAVDRTTVAALHDHRSRQLAERAAAGEDYLDSG